MAITFLCPSGHKLSSPDELAGKPGKCPKCGVTFRVPVPEPDEPAESEQAESPDESESPAAAPAAEPSKTPPKPSVKPSPASAAPAPSKSPAWRDSPPPVADDPTEPTLETTGEGELELGGSEEDEPGSLASFLADDGDEAEDDPNQIVFLCPNGHRLHGPASLVGKPGQCPYCNARFLVPSPDDVADDEDEAAEPTLDQILIQIDSPSRLGKRGKSGSGVSHASPPPPPMVSANALAELFGQLWRYKDHGATIELHLGEGETLVPDSYAPGLSAHSHAVFGMREAGSSYTMTAVAWSTITRIAVRGLDELPAEWFDGS